jgi:hypothetical protein
MDKNQLKATIDYERKRWLRLNGFNTDSRVKRRELDYVKSLRYVEYYLSFPKWKRLFVGGGTLCVSQTSLSSLKC